MPADESAAAWDQLTGLIAGDGARIAVVDNAAALTYASLRARIGYAVQQLRRHDIGPGDSVLMITPNRCEAVVAYLAALVAGARIVLVDQRAGERDVEWAAAVTRPRALISLAGQAPAGIDVPALSLSDIADGESTFPTPVDRLPGDEAVVVFTSGTSSHPKGVRHSLKSLAAGVRNFRHVLGFSAPDTAILVSPLASITGVLQMHLALGSGGGLVLEDAFEPAATLGRAVTHRATVFGGVPFVLEQLLAQADLREGAEMPLRAVAIGGASIPRVLLENAARRYGILPSRIYGSSECPVSFGSAPDDPLESRLADEGVAMPGVQGRIDPSNGELQIRGEHVFLGYVDAQDNADAFTGDGWFRTGDLARLDAGRLTVTGRLKEVVVRKGVKISMAQVDSLMSGMPGVLEAASFARPDPQTGERLVMAVRVEDDVDLALADVTRWLSSAGLAKGKLPEDVVVWTEPLPRTETGKVLRRALDRRPPSQ